MGAGLEAVFLENRASLLRFLRARGAPDPEDLLQDLWMRASAAASAPIADPLAYLYRTANNLMLDRHRAEMRRARREQAWTTESGEVGAPELLSGERIVIARDQLQAVETALSTLGERTETIFRRHRIDGVSQRLIADEMGIGLSAVEKHLQKAYRVLLSLRRSSDAE